MSIVMEHHLESALWDSESSTTENLFELYERIRKEIVNQSNLILNGTLSILLRF